MFDFHDKVVYQIYPRSFMDSNGDGIGDINGIIEKLDYLQTLGVDYLWITPIFISPQNDNGYDIADYYAIDPVYGTMQDLETLIQEASIRNIAIMLDMVFNHTSTSHIWFQKALSGDPTYMDYYIFQDGSPHQPPSNWQSKFGGSAWKYVPSLKKWYLHLFDVTQADLNWKNPAVREELKNIILFWKEKGIRGFRFDVINLIAKPEFFLNDPSGDGRCFYTDGPNIHNYLKELVKDTHIENLLTVGEMSSTTIESCLQYANPYEKELSMCFHFHHLKIDYKNNNKWELTPANLEQLKMLFQTWQLQMQKQGCWDALFWCNHDQPRSVSRFGDEQRYHKESAKMLAVFIHMMRGTPYIYQGEEIGMTNPHFKKLSQYRDVESLNYYSILIENGKTPKEALKILEHRSRDNARTPMQWTNSFYAGFSTHKPWIDIPLNYSTINAENEQNDSNSIFYFYQKLIRLRKQYNAISHGQISFPKESNPNLFTYKRYNKATELYIYCNLTSKKDEVSQVLPPEKYNIILQNYEHHTFGDKIILQPYEALVLENLDYNKEASL